MHGNIFVSLTRLLVPVYELIYPPVCRSCACRIPERTEFLCDRCSSDLTVPSQISRVYLIARDRLCHEGPCHSLVTGFLFREEGVIQGLIHRIKYEGDMKLAVAMGGLVSARVRSHCREIPIDGIVPLPLHRSRLRERGFNQAELIASGIAAGTGYRLLTPLKRRKYTRSQTTLSAAERTGNVRDAFVVPDRFTGQVRGKRFVLVDDVLTTGATLKEAARSLTRAGALRPLACVIALAD